MKLFHLITITLCCSLAIVAGMYARLPKVPGQQPSDRCFEIDVIMTSGTTMPTMSVPASALAPEGPTSVPTLPVDYILPSLVEFASFPSLSLDERIISMATKMQSRADFLENTLKATPPATLPAAPTSAASTGQQYGGEEGAKYFVKDVIMQELISYFRELDDASISTTSAENLMRFLGKLRHYIAVKTGSEDAQDFGLLHC